jgi:hypothetical protein
MKNKTVKSLFFLGLLTFLSSCQQIDGQSLLSNESVDDQTFEVDRTPKSDELYLAVDSPSVNATGKTKADISGSCFTSTYPQHNIIVTFNGAAIRIVDYNTATPAAASTALCKNGRFNLAINTGTMAGSYSLRVILRAYDEAGALVTNDAQGASSITLTR